MPSIYKFITYYYYKSYTEIVGYYKLESIELRRLKIDLTTIFKMLNTYTDINISDIFNIANNYRTRGNCKKINVIHNYDNTINIIDQLIYGIHYIII